MIGNIKYDDFDNMCKVLEDNNSKLKETLKYFKDNKITNTSRMERFSEELDSYIAYLRNNLNLNRDADLALEKIRELNK